MSLAYLLLCAPALADEGSAEAGVEVHGFVSQGFIKTTTNNYLANSERGSFEFTEVGVNFTRALTDELRVGIQLFARDLGPTGNYKPQFDWFYFDYRFFDWLGIRAGRTKLPFGLYNESNDIDAARVPILLPQSVYPVSNRDFLLAQTGLELYGDLPLGAVGELEYRMYGGTIFIDATDSPTVEDLSVPYLFGGRLMWQTPLEGFQAGASVQRLRLDLDFVPDAQTLTALESRGAIPANFAGVVPLQIPALLWVGSLEYAAHDLLLAAEYSRWHVDVDSAFPTVFPEQETVSERFYGMASYRVNPWFNPGVYYSVLYPNVDDRDGRDAYQHDLAATFRYDLNAHWLLKLEGHYMHGTAALNRALNDNARLDTLSKNWGLLLIKTTAYF